MEGNLRPWNDHNYHMKLVLQLQLYCFRESKNAYAKPYWLLVIPFVIFDCSEPNIAKKCWHKGPVAPCKFSSGSVIGKLHREVPN